MVQVKRVGSLMSFQLFFSTQWKSVDSNLFGSQPISTDDVSRVCFERHEGE